MIKSFFKTTVRNLWKNKTNSFLNIFGLAIGIACAGLIFLWVENELGYDSFNTKKDRLYYTRMNQNYDKGIFTHGSTPGLLGPALPIHVAPLKDKYILYFPLVTNLFMLAANMLSPQYSACLPYRLYRAMQKQLLHNCIHW